MRKVILILLLNCLGFHLSAQEVIRGNTNTWFMVWSRFYLTDKLSITGEIHERTGDFFSDQAQFILRPALDYRINQTIEASAGYTFIHSNPYVPYSLPDQRNENNIWEQILLRHGENGFDFQHRFRQEHRWVGSFVERNNEIVQEGVDFRNRFRYRIGVTKDLFTLKNGDIFFAHIFDEIWLNQNERLFVTDFARNWMYLGVGYRLNKDTNFQLAFVHQWDRVNSDLYVESPVVQFSFLKTMHLKP